MKDKIVNYILKKINLPYRVKDLPRPKPGDTIRYRYGGNFIGSSYIIKTGIVVPNSKKYKEADLKYDRPFTKYGYIHTEPKYNKKGVMIKSGGIVHPLQIISVEGDK